MPCSCTWAFKARGQVRRPAGAAAGGARIRLRCAGGLFCLLGYFRAMGQLQLELVERPHCHRIALGLQVAGQGQAVSRGRPGVGEVGAKCQTPSASVVTRVQLPGEIAGRQLRGKEGEMCRNPAGPAAAAGPARGDGGGGGRRMEGGRALFAPVVGASVSVAWGCTWAVTCSWAWGQRAGRRGPLALAAPRAGPVPTPGWRWPGLGGQGCRGVGCPVARWR